MNIHTSAKVKLARQALLTSRANMAWVGKRETSEGERDKETRDQETKRPRDQEARDEETKISRGQ